MLHERFKTFAGVVALSAILVVGGVRVLHSDATDLQSTISKTPASDTGSLWLSYTPDCALLALLWAMPKQDFISRTTRRAARRLSHFDEFVQHKRPPPLFA